MKMGNDEHGYGAVSQALHWFMALGVIGLFSLGLWMTSLTYYDAWYTRGPYIHEGVGAFLIGALVFRLYWRITSPAPDGSHLKRFEQIGAVIVHWSLYVLLAAILISGYLISTVDGRPLNVFDWFSLPAILHAKGLEEQAGAVHYYLSFALIALTGMHTAAALKHHFVNRDPTLTRMLPLKTSPPDREDTQT